MITNSFKEEVHQLEARYNKSLAYVRKLVTENKDLRGLMSKYIKVGEVRLKKWVQEPQERGDTSEKVYGMLNKVLHTSEATHIYDSRKYERLQIKLHNLEERVLNISKAFDMTDYQAITCHLKIFLSFTFITGRLFGTDRLFGRRTQHF